MSIVNPLLEITAEAIFKHEWREALAWADAGEDDRSYFIESAKAALAAAAPLIRQQVLTEVKLALEDELGMVSNASGQGGLRNGLQRASAVVAAIAAEPGEQA